MIKSRENLGNICNFQGGSQPPKKEFKYIPIEGYVRFLQIRDFSSDKNITYIPQSKKNRYCEVNDILIGRYGASVGKILRGLSGAYNVALMKVIPNEEQIFKPWLYYYLSSSLFQKPLQRVANRSAQNGFNKDEIAQFKVDLPSLSEQKSIVNMLDAAFAEISYLQNLVEKEILDAKSCHIQIEHNLISELLKFSKKSKLGEIASFKNGMNFKKNESGKKYKIVGVGDFKSKFSIHNEELESISLTGLIDNSYCLKGGDILFVRSNGNKNLIGRSLLVEELSETTTFSGFTIRCRLEKDDLLPKFVCRFLKSKAIRKQLIDGGSGTSINNLNQKMLSALEIPIVDPKEQKNILDKINLIESSFEKLVTTKQHKLELLNSLKETILTQEMQSGNS